MSAADQSPARPAAVLLALRALGAGRRLADFVLPPQCAACGARVERTGHVCGDCWRGLASIAPPFCSVTGVPFAFDPGEARVSLAARSRPPSYDRARAAVLFNDVARGMVHALKYRDRHDLAGIMARMMTAAAGDVVADAAAVVPVPLHWSRLWRRRFNQSALLAQAVARQTRLPWYPDLIRRVRPTRQQVGLTSRQRSRNVAGAFAIAPDAAARVSGTRLLLVDDVLTTGATVEACARALRRAGAARIDVLTFARVAEIIDNPV